MSSFDTSTAVYIAIVLVGTIICGVLQFRHDQRRACSCGSNQWDDWAECSTCHSCGRVW